MCDFTSGLPAAAVEPVPESSVSTVEERTQEERERWWKMGLKAISDGKLAVLLLSGGQVLYVWYNNPFSDFLNSNAQDLLYAFWYIISSNFDLQKQGEFCFIPQTSLCFHFSDYVYFLLI